MSDSRGAVGRQVSLIRKIRTTPARMIFLGFIALILIGTLLLSLPASASSGSGTNFINALFTATSSACVTGLVVVDTNTYWSVFGKIVILALIQIGALGIMSVVTLFATITGRTLGLSQRMALKESLSNFSIENIGTVFTRILKVTLVVEGAGAIIASITLIPIYGFLGGIGKSIFHSVSSFCNAGFDIFGTAADQFTSLTGFQNNYLLLLTTASLTIFGGLGYIAWEDISSNRKLSRLTLHTKIVLVMTVILLVAGTVSYMVFESGNTMKELPPHLRLLNSFFHSASARTAGFNTLPLDKIEPTTGLTTIVLMFIGASPGSTAGGLKTTTFFVLALTVITFLRGRSEIQVFRNRIGSDVINKAVAIFLLSLALTILTAAVLLVNDKVSLMQSLFEATSAFGTVGLTTGITPDLSVISKYQLTITMLLGRVGTITVFAAFTSMQKKEKVTFRYPEGKITVG